MSSKRGKQRQQLQADINRTLKAIDEGVESFEHTLTKLSEEEEDSAKKAKYMDSLKKDLKKLQRHRDQVRSWLSQGESQETSSLENARSRIEAIMEQFKLVERDAKGSKGGDEASVFDSGPKSDVRVWFRRMTSQIQNFIEKCESDISNSRKKVSRNKQTTIEAEISLHEHLVSKLHQIQIFFENESLKPSDLDYIKDQVEEYVSFKGSGFTEGDIDEFFLDIDEIAEAGSDVPTDFEESQTPLDEGDESIALNDLADGTPGTPLTPSVSAIGIPTDGPSSPYGSARITPVDKEVIKPKKGIMPRAAKPPPMPESVSAQVGSKKKKGKRIMVDLSEEAMEEPVMEVEAIQPVSASSTPMASDDIILPAKSPRSEEETGAYIAQMAAKEPQPISPSAPLNILAEIEAQIEIEERKAKVLHVETPTTFTDIWGTWRGELEAAAPVFAEPPTIAPHVTSALISSAVSNVRPTEGNAYLDDISFQSPQYIQAPLDLVTAFSEEDVDRWVQDPACLMHSLYDDVSGLGQSKRRLDGAEVPPSYPKVPLQLSEEAWSKMDDETLFFIFYFHPGTLDQYRVAQRLEAKGWRYHRFRQMWFSRRGGEFSSAKFSHFDPGSWTTKPSANPVQESEFLNLGECMEGQDRPL